MRKVLKRTLPGSEQMGHMACMQVFTEMCGLFQQYDYRTFLANSRAQNEAQE